MLRKWKASFTVEASLIVPIMLGVFALTMQMGIVLHEEIEEENEVAVELCGVKEFYLYQVMGVILDD